MNNDTEKILATFQAYGRTFEDLNPSTALRFFNYPAILISSKQQIALTNGLIGWVVFKRVMGDLKRRGYKYGRMHDLNVRHLDAQLAIVTGLVIRYQANDEELERFNLVYTFRKVGEDWKIIAGILHDVL